MSIQKTSDYREWYQREKKSKFYNPVIHLGFNFVVLFSLTLTHVVMDKNWSILSAFLLGGIFLLGKVVVWIVHKYPLHRKYKLWSFPYEAHTVEHHRYFTSDLMTIGRVISIQAIF